MKKRLLAIFMSLCMMAGIVPVRVFAQGDAADTLLCICENLCTEDDVNGKCTVCTEDDTKCCAQNSGSFGNAEEENDMLDGDAYAEYSDTGSDFKEEYKNEGKITFGLFDFNTPGTSADNPVAVPGDGLAFSNGVVYGISQEWYKEKKKEITGSENVEENRDFRLYVSVAIPSEIGGTPVKTIAFNSFNNGYTDAKYANGAMYVQTDATKKSYLDIGTFSVVSIDMENANNLETMEHQIFNGCTDLSGVVDLSNTKIEAVEKFTFSDCSKLKGVVLPDTLKRIGSQVFMGCTSLEFITTDDKYDRNDSDFTDFSLPNGLETIENHAFVNAFADVELTLVIPESVTTIESEAFYTHWNSSSINYLPIRTIIVKGTDVSGYDSKAFKYYNGSINYPPHTVVMPNKEVYEEFMKKAGGFSSDKNSISYPLEVSFYKTETAQDSPLYKETKLYNQSVRYIEKNGLWYYDDTYALPEIPDDVEPQPGYKESVWIMDGKELTVNSKVTSDTVTLRAGGELEDPQVIFNIKAYHKNGEMQTATMKSGQVLPLPINQYQRVDIVPEITHPLAGKNKDDIFFWYKWNDSDDVRDNESAFRYGAQINTLRIDDISDARAGNSYYQLDIDGRTVGSSWGPSYDWDTRAYTSSDKQYYIKINLTLSAENLAYVSESEYLYFAENVPQYMLSTVYDTAEELISEYLYKTFGEETYIESETREGDYLFVDWALKAGSIYSSEPGEYNTFVWTASEEEFVDLGWTNTNNIPLKGEVAIQNPYSITFTADGDTADVKYLTKLGTLAVADFPSVPEKRGYTGAWSVTEDIIEPVSNIVITANYTPVVYNISYELNGGQNSSDNPGSYTVENDIMLKNPENPGYTFVGWTFAGQSEPQKDLHIAAGSRTGDLVFTAHWSKNTNGTSSGSHTSSTYYVRYHSDDDIVRDGKYKRGDTVTVKGAVFTAPEGEMLAGWSLEEGGKVDYQAGDTFRMPGNHLDLYAVWIDAETELHSVYISGYPDGTVGPDKTITRAEAATMFYNLLADKTGDAKTFTDISADQWYTKAVTVLAGKGVISGYPDGTFRPNAPITRAEFVTMAMNFANADKGTVCAFPGVPQNMWYYGAIAGATQNGWISGYPDGTFGPGREITRAEVTSVINRMENRAADMSFILENLEELRTFSDLPLAHWAYGPMMEAANGHAYVRKSAETEEAWVEVL